MVKKDKNKKTAAIGNSKVKYIVLISAAVLVVAAVILAYWLISHHRETDTELGYESSAVTATNADDLQKLVDGMIERTKDGRMSLEYKNVAVSKDGKTFSCLINNSAKNKYDMYLEICEDNLDKTELFLTKLIKPGDGIKEFTVTKSLTPGTHNVILVFTQVKDDHKTIQGQISVAYTLSVSK